MKPSVKLLRVLGAVFGLSAVVGGMVGQGILRTPGLVAEGIGSPTGIIMAWFFGGFLAMIGAFAFAELSASIPSAGAEYTFSQRAYGRFVGTIVGWINLVTYGISCAMLSTVSGEFLQRLGLMATYPTAVPALLVLGTIFLLNWSGTRVAGDSQVILVAIKGIILVALIAWLLSQPGAPRTAPATDLNAGGLLGIAVALRMVNSTYDGWAGLCCYAEEIKDPGRVIPRMLFGGIAGVTVLYVLSNLAFLHALSAQGMAGSKFVAGDALSLTMGDEAALALTIFATISVIAITHVNVMGAVRCAFALGREGDLPRKLGEVASNGTPRLALLTVSALATGFIVSGSYEGLVAANVVNNIIVLILVNLAAWRLRRIEPDLPRPFRIPLFPLPLILALGLNIVLLTALIYEDPIHSLQGFVVLAGLAALDVIKRILVRRSLA